MIETELKHVIALTKPLASVAELKHVIALTKPLSSADMEPSDCAALVGSFAKAQRRQGA